MSSNVRKFAEEDYNSIVISDEEKAFVKARLEEDVGDSGLTRRPTLKDIKRIFKDCGFQPLISLCAYKC